MSTLRRELSVLAGARALGARARLRGGGGAARLRRGGGGDHHGRLDSQPHPRARRRAVRRHVAAGLGGGGARASAAVRPREHAQAATSERPRARARPASRGCARPGHPPRGVQLRASHRGVAAAAPRATLGVGAGRAAASSALAARAADLPLALSARAGARRACGARSAAISSGRRLSAWATTSDACSAASAKRRLAPRRRVLEALLCAARSEANRRVRVVGGGRLARLRAPQPPPLPPSGHRGGAPRAARSDPLRGEPRPRPRRRRARRTRRASAAVAAAAAALALQALPQRARLLGDARLPRAVSARAFVPTASAASAASSPPPRRRLWSPPATRTRLPPRAPAPPSRATCARGRARRGAVARRARPRFRAFSRAFSSPPSSRHGSRHGSRPRKNHPPRPPRARQGAETPPRAARP